MKEVPGLLKYNGPGVLETNPWPLQDKARSQLRPRLSAPNNGHTGPANGAFSVLINTDQGPVSGPSKDVSTVLKRQKSRAGSFSRIASDHHQDRLTALWRCYIYPATTSQL